MKKRIREIYKKHIENNLLAKRFGLVFSVDMLVRGGNFLLIPLFLHLMTKEEFGLYGYLSSFVFTASFTINLGFYLSMSKMYFRYNSERLRGEMLFTLNITLIGFILLLFTCSYLFGWDIQLFNLLLKGQIDSSSFSYSSYRPYILIAIFAYVFNLVLLRFFLISESIKMVQRYNLSRLLLVNAVVLSVLYLSDSDKALARLMWTFLSETLLIFIFGTQMVKKMNFHYNVKLLIKGLKIGFPIMAAAVFTAMATFGDKYFVFSGENDYAVYTLALLIASIFPNIQTSFNNIWQPLFLQEKNKNTQIRKTNRYALLMAFSFLALSLFILLAVWVSLHLGIIPQTYEKIYAILAILLLGQTISCCSVFYCNFMTHYERTHIQAIWEILSGIGVMGLYAIAIPRWGMMGAGACMIVLYTTSLLFYRYHAMRFTRKKP